MSEKQPLTRFLHVLRTCSMFCTMLLLGTAVHAQSLDPSEDEDATPSPPVGWGFYGNSSDGNATDGAGDPWLGTSDETDLILKSAGQERMRLRAMGNTFVSDTLVTDNLRVLGTTAMDSVRSVHVRVNRISSQNPGDSLIFFGDSSIVMDHVNHHIFASPQSSGQNIDLKIQCHTAAQMQGGGGTTHTLLNNPYGNVGIGLGSPQEKLHVSGDVRITGSKLRVNSSGNVGIGTSTPQGRLDVRNTSNVHALRVLTDGKVIAGLVQQSGHTARLYLGDVNHYIGSGYGQGLNLSTYGAVNALVIKESSGNVGIGLTNPGHKLDVCGTIRSKEWIVELAGCDFVFEEDYELPDFRERLAGIRSNKRLPYILSAKEMQTAGAPMGDSFLGLLRNLEELYLYVGQLEERMNRMDQENMWLREELGRLINR